MVVNYRRDMGRRKDELQELRQALLKAHQDIERLSRTKSDFVSIISHELRTPLTSIKESIALVLEGVTGPLNEEQKNLLLITKNNIDRLADVIVNVLDFAKLQSGEFTIRKEKTDINKVIKDICAKAKSSIEKKDLDVSLKLSDDLGLISVDSERISKVFKSLLSNAIKFNREKGHIRIYSTREDDNGDHFVKVAVEDTGIGISEGDLKRLFKEFNPLDTSMTRSAGGIGLELAICKNIIGLHGGEIWAESKTGIGSKFIVRLPNL